MRRKMKHSITFFLGLCIIVGACSQGIYMLPLQGDFSELFFYYTTVEVGTPAQSFTVIVDTGSSDFLVPSRECSTCSGDPSTFYCSSCSSTSSSISCQDKSYTCSNNCTNGVCHYAATYAGGLVEYAEATQDVVQLTLSNISARVSFGNVYMIDMGNDTLFTNTVRSRANAYPEGMWGLAYQSESAVGAPTVIDSFVASGVINDVFSMCLDDVGGMLVLGGIYPGYTDISYVPMPFETFYTFTALDFTANDESVPGGPYTYDPKYSIVDSGTPFPTVPTPVYAALRALVTANCSTNPLVGVCTGVTSQNETLFDGYCFDITPAQQAQFPTLKFILQGEDFSNVSLSLPPSVYLQKQYFCNESTAVGLGLSQDPQFTIIGAQMMQSYLTVFDRENKRLGFANKLKCS